MQVTTDDHQWQCALNAEIDAERALAKAKQQTPAPYERIAPYIPKGEYSNQRYFSRSKNDILGLQVSSAEPDDYGQTQSGVEVSVYRNSRDSTADIRFEFRAGANHIRALAACTACELREIAYRLLDAAHDIEDFPA